MKYPSPPDCIYTVESRYLEQNNPSHPYQFTKNDYSISRTLDVSNKFVRFDSSRYRELTACMKKSYVHYFHVYISIFAHFIYTPVHKEYI